MGRVRPCGRGKREATVSEKSPNFGDKSQGKHKPESERAFQHRACTDNVDLRSDSKRLGSCEWSSQTKTNAMGRQRKIVSGLLVSNSLSKKRERGKDSA